MHGSLRAVSVGFVPLADTNGGYGESREGNFHYFGQELLEVSVVNIPSNPDALKRSLLDLVDPKEIKEIKEEVINKNFCNIQEKRLLLINKK